MSAARRDADEVTPLDFRRLFDAEMPYVWKTLRRLGVDAGEVPDVANEVWILVHRRLDTYDRMRPIRPWLFGIAFRVATAHFRSSRRRHEFLSEDGEPAQSLASDVPPADEQLSAQDAHRLVVEALQFVDLERRAIFVMHDMDELPMKEISEVLGVAVNTAYSRLRLARDEFKVAINRLEKRRSP